MNNVISKPAKTRITKVLVIIALSVGAFYAGFPVLWMLVILVKDQYRNLCLSASSDYGIIFF